MDENEWLTDGQMYLKGQIVKIARERNIAIAVSWRFPSNNPHNKDEIPLTVESSDKKIRMVYFIFSLDLDDKERREFLEQIAKMIVKAFLLGTMWTYSRS